MGLSAVCAASLQLDTDFETGLGHNAQPIASSIFGLTFSSFDGLGDTSDMYFADITSGWYNATSDNGSSYEAGEYYVGGNVAAFVPDLGWDGKIAFTLGTASAVQLGYSSEFDILLDGYDAGGDLVATTSGVPNTKSQGGTGLGELSLTSAQANISYVVIAGDGGYWMVDDLYSDAQMPEPGSLLALGVGLVALVGLVSRRRS